MKRKITTAPILILFVLASLALQAPTQDLGQNEALENNPRIIIMPDQKMLVVQSKGDPNVTGGAAFGLLFKAFFSLPGAKMTGAPRARWPNILSDPKGQWIGLYAIPVPDSVTAAPAGMTGVRIETWTYGEVAEIVHVGSYADETLTIQKLMAFIAEKGYVIVGPHEEEYLKGPGQAASPAEYLTIIRYQVKKK